MALGFDPVITNLTGLQAQKILEQSCSAGIDRCAILALAFAGLAVSAQAQAQTPAGVFRKDSACDHNAEHCDPSPAAEANADGPTTVYFSPTQPGGVKRGNWVQTTPGRGWFTILRLYSPLEPFFTKAWQPSELEIVR